MSSNFRVGVVGGGVVGLSSALAVASNHPNVDVTVISDKDLKDTTSFGPPGLFRPSLHEITKQWARDSYDHYSSLAGSQDGPLAGVQYMSGYVLDDNMDNLQTQKKSYGDIVTSFRWLEPTEMKIFAVPFKYGFFYTTITAQGGFYLPWLAEQVRSKGCKFAKQRVNSFAEIADCYDALINCTGLGARILVPDEAVIPMRGIALKVLAPWIKHFLLCDEDSTYIIPGIEHVFLGTVRQANNWKTTIEISERNKILNRCSEVVPSLKNLKFLDEWAGLRPYRPAPRFDLEILKSNDRSIPLIHNYGHGGNGITMSWGSAVQVNQVLNEQMRMKAKL